LISDLTGSPPSNPRRILHKPGLCSAELFFDQAAVAVKLFFDQAATAFKFFERAAARSLVET
jgi:hypothetical protein